MRRHVWTLMVPMFLGCSGANVVSGTDQTDAEKLASDLPSWCEETCNRIIACDNGAGESCSCDGDICECSTPTMAECQQDCEEALSDFSKTTEACADVGRRYVACIDTLGCDELHSEPPCLPPRTELEACEVDDDDDPPQAGTGGTSGDSDGGSSGGTVSSAGTSTGGYSGGDVGGTGSGGYAGTNVGGTGVAGTGPVGPVVTCDVGSGSGAAGSANMGGGAYVTCEETRQECSDGHAYGWICVDDANGHNWCSCFLDNNPVGALPSMGLCPSVPEVNAACGWNLSVDF